ncbi:MAG: asparagine synthase (glutamine-hydrolyzing) [Candidatus Omnitrophota bacterium]|nr:asparagine synthase (glutamine-hydrolyzing) [Candidatus Omnitrophota bacterium]
MCGICGIIKFNQNEPVQKDILSRMSKSLFHRGPDDQGYYIEGNVGLASQRLSIIDVKGGHQPIHNEDSTIWIAYNGEIFNFKELRKNLESRGHNFYTQTDTEVIIHLYEEFGLDFIKMLNGMFAFAIWDKNKKRLILAIDRFGIKPLHYCFYNQNLVFGSEIKALLEIDAIDKELDYAALNQYFTYTYIISDRTIFKSIKKMLPGHMLIYDSGRIEMQKYWDIEFKIDRNMDEESIKFRLKELLTKSVKDRLVSEVPLGIFLSGGVDSSIITGLASRLSTERIKTFSMGFDVASHNELKYAKLVAEHFKTEHHEFMVKGECINYLPEIMDYIDEPFADSSVIPTYLICRLSKQYVTVALTGDGGDELFAGYSWTSRQRLIDRFNNSPRFFRNILYNICGEHSRGITLFGKLTRFINDTRISSVEGYRRRITAFTKDSKTNLYSGALAEKIREGETEDIIKEYSDYFKDSDCLDKMLGLDMKIYLYSDGLTKIDRMSMANSLEIRPPLLDNDFVELVLTIDNHLKAKGMVTKYILKQTFADLLPSKILKQRKQGFSIPLHVWFRGDLKDYLGDILTSDSFAKRGFFNRDYALDLMEKHQSGRYNFASQLWTLVVFENWAKKYGVTL